jgi:hypothetical protein
LTQVLQKAKTHIATKESSVVTRNVQIWIYWGWYFKTEYIVLLIVLAFSAKVCFPKLKIVAMCLNIHDTYLNDRLLDHVAQKLLWDRTGEFSVLPFFSVLKFMCL